MGVSVGTLMCENILYGSLLAKVLKRMLQLKR